MPFHFDSASVSGLLFFVNSRLREAQQGFLVSGQVLCDSVASVSGQRQSHRPPRDSLRSPQQRSNGRRYSRPSQGFHSRPSIPNSTYFAVCSLNYITYLAENSYPYMCRTVNWPWSKLILGSTLLRFPRYFFIYSFELLFLCEFEQIFVWFWADFELGSVVSKA